MSKSRNIALSSIGNQLLQRKSTLEQMPGMLHVLQLAYTVYSIH